VAVQVQLKWIDGFQFVARAGDGPAVVIDTNGGSSGPDPMEMLLMGLGGCTAVDVVLILQKKRVRLTGFEVNVRGERAEEHPRRYTDIYIEYVLRGRGIKATAVEQAIQLSQEKYCSALASLNVRFSHTYRIVESEGAV
jgi:putative redox protein